MTDASEYTDAELRSVWPETQHGRWMDPSFESGLVSVIVPTYNRAEYLPRTLNSVWNQTYRPIELIVVDDGSTDATPDRVEEWQRTHSGDEEFTTRYVRQENSGPSAARNYGMIASTGQYLQFLDSDDCLHPQKLEIHVAALEAEPSCGFVGSTHDTFDLEGGHPTFPEYDVGTLIAGSDYEPHVEIFGAGANLWNGFYRRELCVRAGPINENVRRMEDVEFNFRVTAQHPACRFVDATLIARGEHGEDRLTGVKEEYEGIETGFEALDAMENTLNGLGVTQTASVRHTVANFYLGIARLAMRVGTKQEVKRALNGALRNRREVSFVWKVRGLDAVYRLLGGTASRTLWTLAT